MANILWLSTFAIMLALGQILFKQAALHMQGRPLIDGFVTLAHAPILYGALALYGAATILWVWILSRVPLSQAYPWVALAIGGVPLLASIAFHERTGPVYWLGILLVMLGVLLTQYGSKA